MNPASKSNEWLFWPKRNPGAALRLICLPYAGGGAQAYIKWADRLPDAVELGTVNLPGRGRRLMEPALREMSSLISALTAMMQPLITKPFVLYGHSMGALIAFELARSLRNLFGALPERIIVSGAFAPHLPDPRPLRHLSDAEFLSEIRALGGMPDQVLASDELLQLMLPTLRADFTLTETYKHQPGVPLSCPISALYGSDDPVGPESMVFEWARHTTASCTFHKFPGDHFFTHSEENAVVRTLSNILSETAAAAKAWRRTAHNGF